MSEPVSLLKTPFLDLCHLHAAVVQVVAALKERPHMLGLQLEPVKRRVGYLAANGKGMEEVAQLLATTL